MVVENISDRRLENVEKELLKGSLLKLNDLDKSKFFKRKPIAGLEFILNQQKNRDTKYISNGITQCYNYRRRSQGDLFLIMKYYYPNITFKEVRQLLFDLLNNGRATTTFCSTIDKRVFFRERGNAWNGSVYHREYFDEYGFKLKII